ncbi:DUF1878 family protein [Anaerobacillus alkaliphilus]|uniref:DUF1878 family protein n=1 Tax=Anaerobacillus alkaliphilus TaxID=1548597 RepID=A0A4Q0VS11_9BACI|nr:DUF1878 family protein [Anaerobacillus alkaliphilus]RXI99886.1 DUF1878 family protein [Anaerobacillus alkaliphilus]
METNEDKMLRLEFYQELFLSVINNSYPFYALIIKHELSKKEVEEIYVLCTKLNNEYKRQKEEGFVTFLPLLTHFVGMLNYKLNPHKTIDALYEQGIYQGLMAEFISIIQKN